MNKVIMAIIGMAMIGSVAAQAATVSEGQWCSVIVKETGVRADGMVSILVLDNPDDDSYPLPGPQWANLTMDTDAAKGILAICLTAVSLEKTAMIQVSPISDGVCSILAITVQQ